jgi:hypothetical protein
MRWLGLVCLTAVALVAAGCLTIHVGGNIAADGERDETSQADACDGRPQKVLRHVVLFRFKEGTSAVQIRELEQAFRKRTDVGPVIASEWGTDVSHDDRARGFTHCFTVTLRDEAAREAYYRGASSPRYWDTLRVHLDDWLVFDYWGEY